MTLVENLQDAINTGEVLTVVYHGGHAPGTKRRIMPRRLAGELVYAKDFGETIIKSYRVDRMEIGSDDHPAPWMPTTPKLKYKKVDPDSYFGGWAFEIRSALWPTLGVIRQDYVDREKTKVAREAARARGADKDTIARTAIRYSASAIATSPAYDFHEGDLFHSMNRGIALQVIGVGEYIEVHEITNASEPRRHAFHVTDTELADWLRTGEKPHDSRIGRGQSYSEVLRFHIEEPFTTA